MRSDAKKVFYYDADASSLGGHMVAPFHEVIPSQASVSLSAAGGYVTARTEAFNFKEIVSCRSTYARVSGRSLEKGGPWSTLATSVLEGINILEILTAERIVAQVSVEHPADGGPAQISFAGSRFEGLRVGGQEVSAVLNTNLLTIGASMENGHARVTWPDLLRTGQEQAGKLVQSISQAKNRDAYGWALQRYGWMESTRELQKDGCVLCSLVDGVEGAVPGNSIGHFVEIPDFGRIFLGEMLVYPRSIQLSMLRAELGCNGLGTIGGSGVHINGSTMPPS